MGIMSNLKRIRLEQALSLRALSTLSGVSVTTIARAERGEDVYTVTVRKLARALGVKPADLMAPPVPATTPTAIRSSEQRARMLEALREDARRARERGDAASAGRYEAAIASYES